MKKGLIIICSILILLGCLLYVGYEYATDYVVKKTLLMVAEDTELQAQIDAALEQVQPTPSEKPENKNVESEGENVLQSTPNPNSTSKPTAAPSVKTGDSTLSIDDLQPSDKEYVMRIYKRFTAVEVNRVSAMLPEGITPEEKQIIKSIVYAKVSREEVNKLYAIAKKYR